MTMLIDPVGLPKRSRRGFRFSLRSLLVATTILSVWLGWQAYRAREQREAVAAIRNVIKSVAFGYNRQPAESWAPDWLRAAIGDDYFVNVTNVSISQATSPSLSQAIPQLRRLPELRVFSINDVVAAKGDLTQVASLSQLQRLEFAEIQLTADDMQSIAHMDNIRTLALNGKSATNETVSILPQFANLEVVAVWSDDVSDGGIARLAACPRLKSLSLHCRSLTGRGLKALAEINSLRQLTFENMYFGDGSAESPYTTKDAAASFRLSAYRGEFFQDFTADSSGGFGRISDWFKKLRPDVQLGWSMNIN